MIDMLTYHLTTEQLAGRSHVDSKNLTGVCKMISNERGGVVQLESPPEGIDCMS